MVETIGANADPCRAEQNGDCCAWKHTEISFERHGERWFILLRIGEHTSVSSIPQRMIDDLRDIVKGS